MTEYPLKTRRRILQEDAWVGMRNVSRRQGREGEFLRMYPTPSDVHVGAANLPLVSGQERFGKLVGESCNHLLAHLDPELPSAPHAVPGVPVSGLGRAGTHVGVRERDGVASTASTKGWGFRWPGAAVRGRHREGTTRYTSTPAALRGQTHSAYPKSSHATHLPGTVPRGR